MSNVQKGKNVGIVAHLDEPLDAGLRYARAFVIDDQETSVATVDLINQGNYRFTGDVTMPDRPWIQAEIRVYLDPGYTTEDNDYRDITQVFQRDDAEGGSGGGQKDEEILGFVSSSIINGIINVTIPIKGSVNDSNLKGEIDEAVDLAGVLDSQELVGIVECE